MFDKLFGLPAHPLLIHAPIVLLPLAAVATIAFAAMPSLRRRFGWLMTGSIAVVAALLFAAKESGEAFEKGFDRAFGEGSIGIERHADLAETTFVLTLVWLAVFTVMVVTEFLQRRKGVFNPIIGTTMGSVAAIVAILATVWLIRTGHEGADVVWSPVTPQLFPDA